jgi:hypothetical protein
VWTKKSPESEKKIKDISEIEKIGLQEKEKDKQKKINKKNQTNYQKIAQVKIHHLKKVFSSP